MKKTLTLLVTLCSAIACNKDKGEDSACDDAAMPSVQAVVTDMEANYLDGATVVFDDGTGEQPCDAVGDNFLCGMDVIGSITLTASAPGFTSVTETFDIESSGCHAITVNHAFRLTAE